METPDHLPKPAINAFSPRGDTVEMPESYRMFEIREEHLKKIAASSDPHQRKLLWASLMHMEDRHGCGLSNICSKLFQQWFKTARLRDEAILDRVCDTDESTQTGLVPYSGNGKRRKWS
jgi:hypothetical protein